MTYDKDLRAARRGYRVLTGLNFAAAALQAYDHYWTIAASCIFWGITCLVWTASAASQQRTRDEVRIAAAGVRGLLEDAEHER